MRLEQALAKLRSELDPQLFVVTSSSATQKGACLTDRVVQVSEDPVQFLVAVAHREHLYGIINESRVCALSWLAHDQLQIANHFANVNGFEEDVFADYEYSTGVTESPILSVAPAVVELELRRELVCADSTAYLGDPLEAEVRYAFTPLRKSDI